MSKFLINLSGSDLALRFLGSNPFERDEPGWQLWPAMLIRAGRKCEALIAPLPISGEEIEERQLIRLFEQIYAVCAEILLDTISLPKSHENLNWYQQAIKQMLKRALRIINEAAFQLSDETEWELESRLMHGHVPRLLEEARLRALSAEIANAGLSAKGPVTESNTGTNGINEESTRLLTGQAVRGRALINKGSFWEIRLDGVTCQLQNSKGILHIKELLRSPNKEILATALYAATGLPASKPHLELAEFARDNISSRNVDKTIDRQAHAAVTAQINELTEQCAEATSIEQKEKIEEEINKCRQYLSNNRVLNKSPQQLPYGAIQKSVSRVLKTLQATSGGDDIARYFEAHIKIGFECHYTPEPQAPAWDIHD